MGDAVDVKPAITRDLPCFLRAALVAISLGHAADAAAQQRPDTAYRPPAMAPAYAPGSGPRVLFDRAHESMHALDGSYLAFARLLEADGYRLEPLHDPFTPAVLERAEVVVISNALPPERAHARGAPAPIDVADSLQAFTDAEVDALVGWVERGGALLLIADHMPFPGAVRELAARLGFSLTDSFAIDTLRWDPIVFSRDRGELADHPITRGRAPDERVDSVATFTGQGFRGDSLVQPILVLPDRVTLLHPEREWEFGPGTRAHPAGGWLQGAVRDFGRGRVAMFGEAAMFGAQRAGAAQAPAGMNAPVAAQNPRFILNLMRWLTQAPPAREQPRP